MAVSLAALASRLYPYSSVPIPKFASLAAHSFLNFGIKGKLAIHDSSAVFGFEVPTPTRGYNDRNFKSTALALPLPSKEGVAPVPARMRCSTPVETRARAILPLPYVA
jgi:hypothetical protein